MRKNNQKNPRRKNKTYIPSNKMNPALLSVRISELDKKIEKNTILSEMKEKGLYTYIGLMTNFAGHDLKNVIHNLDGFINTLVIEEITSQDIGKINMFISNIRKTIEDFKTLAPDPI